MIVLKIFTHINLFLNWDIIGIQHYIILKCMTWFNIYIVYCEMITRSLVSIYHHTYNNVSFIMRTFKIFSLSNFQICNIVPLTIVAMLYISSLWVIYFITKFISFDPLYPFHLLPPPNSGNHQSDICIQKLGLGFSF